MVIRSALGALGAVAIIGAVAAALPEHKSVKPNPPAADIQYGLLTKPEFQPPKPPETVKTAEETEASRLVKQVSFPDPAAPAATPSAGPAVAVAEPAKTPPVSAVVIAPDPQPAHPVVPAQSAALAPSPPVASPPTAPSRPDVPSPTRLNINTASANDLDRLPGAGRIGRSIVRRRPYGAVDDLVRKRVLRQSALNRIRGLITVD